MRLKATERHPSRDATVLGPADVNDVVRVSLRLRHRPDSPPLPDLTAKTVLITPITREAFAATYGALPAELDGVADFARSQGLTVVDSDIARRTVWASGTVAQMQDAFGVQLNNYHTTDQTYRGYDGTAALPAALADFVEGVYGLENKRMQRIKMSKSEQRSVSAAGLEPTYLTPPEVASLYNFPGTNAAGETIGILEFDNDDQDKPGYVESDIETYFTAIELTMPNLVNVYIDDPPHRTESNLETVLDICVAGSVAQQATLAVYFGPESERGIIDTICAAVHDSVNKPSVLSISYGWVEYGDPALPAVMSAVSTIFQEAAVLGVTVFAASGDAGAEWTVGDRQAHVGWPASDPGVTAVGGTVISNVVTSYLYQENTWPNTGGGVSDYFDMPDWQIDAGVPYSANGDGRSGRGVPDVAAYVGPYEVFLNGIPWQASGTSAAAPLYAALIATINVTTRQYGPGQIGFLNGNVGLRKGLYDDLSCFRDIADGISNGSPGSPGYTAAPGWDACTGWGSLQGESLLEALQQRTPSGVAPGRWQVTLADKGRDKSGKPFISGIAGPMPDGSLWWLTEDQAVTNILGGANTFFVQGSDGSQSEVVVSNALPVGRSYLTTTPDGSKEDNLSALPQF